MIINLNAEPDPVKIVDDLRRIKDSFKNQYVLTDETEVPDTLGDLIIKLKRTSTGFKLTLIDPGTGDDVPLEI